jgi:hypothetical protein
MGMIPALQGHLRPYRDDSVYPPKAPKVILAIAAADTATATATCATCATLGVVCREHRKRELCQ